MGRWLAIAEVLSSEFLQVVGGKRRRLFHRDLRVCEIAQKNSQKRTEIEESSVGRSGDLPDFSHGLPAVAPSS